ncbi:MAG: hypothetical protein NC340_03310 [Ruminococcus flavefaciens]|nr:hypothetical protein [Ruminococcus flavefaciens]MCM1229582.1 hypothetical protein [Ruminococcus flavefaciens]
MTNKELACLLQFEYQLNNINEHSTNYLNFAQKVNAEFNMSIHYRWQLSQVIGDINHRFKNAGYDVPLISVLVYNKKTGLPGEGFWEELYPDIKCQNVLRPQRLAKYYEEVKAVLAYDWSNIFKTANKIAADRGLVT